ncbi:MAG: hypothetical protein ACI4EV_02150 [Lachnospiraceae bacterium]
MGEIITAGGVVLPAPVTLSVDDNIIWSSSTGRTLAGLMVGDIVAEKKTLNITWGLMPEDSYLKIKNNMIAGFFPVKFHDDGIDIVITTYRGTLSKDIIGRLDDGLFWYRSISVQIIQQ